MTGNVFKRWFTTDALSQTIYHEHTAFWFATLTYHPDRSAAPWTLTIEGSEITLSDSELVDGPNATAFRVKALRAWGRLPPRIDSKGWDEIIAPLLEEVQCDLRLRDKVAPR